MGIISPFSLTFHGFLVVSLFFKGTEARSCKRGWTFYKGHCYGLFNNKVTWADAQDDCRSQGGNLASIHFKEQMLHLSRYIKKNIDARNGKGNVWIGLKTAKKMRKWNWVDRSSTRYMPWDDGEPNNFRFDEDCVELLRTKGYMLWNDRNCKRHQSYLCKLFAF